MTYLKQCEANKLKEWSWRSKDRLELFDVKQGKAGFSLPFMMGLDNMHYSLQ